MSTEVEMENSGSAYQASGQESRIVERAVRCTSMAFDWRLLEEADAQYDLTHREMVEEMRRRSREQVESGEFPIRPAEGIGITQPRLGNSGSYYIGLDEAIPPSQTLPSANITHFNNFTNPTTGTTATWTDVFDRMDGMDGLFFGDPVRPEAFRTVVRRSPRPTPVETDEQIAVVGDIVRKWHPVANGRVAELRRLIARSNGRYPAAEQRHRTEIAKIRDENPDLICDQIKASIKCLNQMGASLVLAGNNKFSITWTTDHISFDEGGVHVDCGKFDVKLGIDRADGLFARAHAQQPCPAIDRPETHHPHVCESIICLGEGHTMVGKALGRGQFDMACDLVSSVLHTYSSRNPYCRVRYWYSNEWKCRSCGNEESDVNERGNCIRCDSRVCSECTMECSCCGGFRCGRCICRCPECLSINCHYCVTHCRNCGAGRCKNCITRCGVEDCGRPLCSGCVHSGSDGVSRCEDCHQTYSQLHPAESGT